MSLCCETDESLRLWNGICIEFGRMAMRYGCVSTSDICRDRAVLTSPSLVKLPILNALSVEPGLPPLAEGCGMGDGLWAGEGIRWAPGMVTGAAGVG